VDWTGLDWTKRLESNSSASFIICHPSEAIDTYGYRPLHRMASNNLAIGAAALLEAGADPKAETEHGETPMKVARSAAAWDVVQLLLPYYTTAKGSTAATT
jgi:ankyrin repeat protein